MNIETKEIHIYYAGDEMAKNIEESKLFGWQKTEQTVRHGRSSYGIMARDKDMPHYYEIVELEEKYLELKKKKKTYNKVIEEPVDVLLMFLLILLFVFPFVLYIVFKSNQKKRINEHNSKLQNQMDEYARKAQELINSK